MKNLFLVIIFFPFIGRSQNVNCFIKVPPYIPSYLETSRGHNQTKDSIYVTSFEGCVSKDSIINVFPFSYTVKGKLDSSICKLDYVVFISTKDTTMRFVSSIDNELINHLSSLKPKDIVIIEQLLFYDKDNDYSEDRLCILPKPYEGLYWLIR